MKPLSEKVMLEMPSEEELEKENFVLIKSMCGWHFISRNQTQAEKKRYNGDLSGCQSYANQGCPNCNGEKRTAERDNCQAFYPVIVGYSELNNDRGYVL